MTNAMNKHKRVAAILGVASGSLALFYIFFARALTLKNFGLGVDGQLIAQRIITPLLFVALGALLASCEYFRRVRRAGLPAGAKTGVLVKILCLAAVVVLPVVIVVATMNTPFWSYQSPALWDRPRFDYGWFIPWKGERPLYGNRMVCPFLNLFLWTLYLMVIVGYRRFRHYLVFLVVMLGLFGLYAKFVGVRTIYRERIAQNTDAQRVSAQPKPQSNPQSPFDAMTDEDKAYYAYSFTTIGTVPYGRCWPENLYKILLAGRDSGNAPKLMFNAPQGFKQNEGFPEWQRVKSIIIAKESRSILGTKGGAGPFKSLEDLNAYLNSEVRPDLNSDIFIISNDTKKAGGEMRFVCESKYGTNYVIQIKLREESPTSFWIDVETSLE